MCVFGSFRPLLRQLDRYSHPVDPPGRGRSVAVGWRAQMGDNRMRLLLFNVRAGACCVHALWYALRIVELCMRHGERRATCQDHSLGAAAGRWCGARHVLRSLAVVAAFSMALGAQGGCASDAAPCHRGDYQACQCAGGQEGYAACADDESAQLACDCSGKTPGALESSSDAGASSSGAADAGSGADVATRLPFLAACSGNEECESGMCFAFNSKGMRCTKTCAGPAECPPPSPGCNNKGVCKAP